MFVSRTIKELRGSKMRGGVRSERRQAQAYLPQSGRGCHEISPLYLSGGHNYTENHIPKSENSHKMEFSFYRSM
jgi:hypothetical protein